MRRGGDGYLLQARTVGKGIIPHLAQAFSQDNRVQIVAAPECIGLNPLHRVRQHHQLDIRIVLKSPLADDLHRVGNGHVLLRAPIPYQRTSLHLKTGSRC